MSFCKICLNKRSPFVMNNKLVCMHCDELMFDLEIETDEETPVQKAPATDKAQRPLILKRPKITK